jgi:protein gp37
MRDGTFNAIDGIDYEDIGDIRDAGVLSKSEIPGLDWIVVGGESGPKSRPFDLAWARSIVAQCKAANVPVFVKQLGANPILDCPAGEEDQGQFRDDGSARYWTIGFIKDKKGGDINEWPADLQVREWPKEV